MNLYIFNKTPILPYQTSIHQKILSNVQGFEGAGKESPMHMHAHTGRK